MAWAPARTASSVSPFNVKDVVVTGLDDGVYLQLTLGELAADRHGAGMIRAVVVQFATCIAESQTASLQQGCRRIAVHDFAMLREDGGEAGTACQTACYAVDLSAYEALRNARLDE